VSVSSRPWRRTTKTSRPGLSAAAAALLALCALALPATSASAHPAATTVARPTAARVTRAASIPSVGDLRLTGATADVRVARIYRHGQVAWVNHVLDTRLADIDGCQAVRSPATLQRHVYRSTVHALCLAGTGPVKAAADKLARSRPWYRINVTPVPMVGFTLVADLKQGNDKAVPAALAQLPAGPQVFVDGDDVSLSYAGPGVSQARLDAAVAAFAGALGVPTEKIKVSALDAG
jgi:hypothetical protein